MVPTINGQIKADYVLTNSKIQKYTIEIPANMTSEFQLESFSADTIIHNGGNIDNTTSYLNLDPGVHIIEITNNSI